MSLRYPVFLECVDLCVDPVDEDLFFGLAYGLMPFSVTDDINQGVLLFRRSFGVTDKDKTARAGTANEELAALPEVRWYLAGASSRPWTDHMQPENGAAHRVAWSVAPDWPSLFRRPLRPPKRTLQRHTYGSFRHWYGGPDGSGTHRGVHCGGRCTQRQKCHPSEPFPPQRCVRFVRRKHSISWA
jgi:hypothetical protein